MIGNLTGGTDSISRDIGTVIYRMKMLGFNAIRLPFTFAGLAEVHTCPAPSRTLTLPTLLGVVCLSQQVAVFMT